MSKRAVLLVIGNTVLFCYGCYEATETKNIFQCDYCKIAIYCSRECAKSDWTDHRRECEAYER
jgi:hypothetical protein